MDDEKPSLSGNSVTALSAPVQNPPVKEIGGFADSGLAEPTRFGDWDVRGRCSDF